MVIVAIFSASANCKWRLPRSTLQFEWMFCGALQALWFCFLRPPNLLHVGTCGMRVMHDDTSGHVCPKVCTITFTQACGKACSKARDKVGTQVCRAVWCEECSKVCSKVLSTECSKVQDGAQKVYWMVFAKWVGLLRIFLRNLDAQWNWKTTLPKRSSHCPR